MKGDTKIVALLQGLLAEELTATSQYMVHAEMYANWGLKKFAAEERKRAVNEMKHSEKLIERIIFYQDVPIIKLLKLNIGAKPEEMLQHDLTLEKEALGMYNTAIEIAAGTPDGAVREMLESILKDEDQHVNELEEQLDKIRLMGLQVYLGTGV